MSSPTPDLHALGDAVRLLRIRSRLSQDDLGSRANIHRTHVSLIERGRKDVQYTTLVRVAEALGVTMTELMRLADEHALRR